MEDINTKKKGVQLLSRLVGFKYRSDIYTFMVFVVIATFIWLSIKLSEEYSREFQFSLNVYPRNAEKYVLNSSAEKDIRLKLSATGFKILRLTLFERNKEVKLAIDEKDLNYRIEDSLYHFALNKADILSKIIDEGVYKIESAIIKTDSLFYTLDELLQRQLKVIPVYNITYSDLFAQSGEVRVSPEFINISGPKKEVSKLKFISTDSLWIDDVKENISSKLAIDSRYLHFPYTASIDEIQIDIPVAEYISASYDVRLEALSENDYPVKLFPATVKISCFIEVSQYQNVTKDQFKAVVHIDNNSTNSLSKIELIAYPKMLRSIKIEPDQVEFIYLQHD